VVYLDVFLAQIHLDDLPYAPPPEALRVPASERILAGEDPPERRDSPLGYRAGED